MNEEVPKVDPAGEAALGSLLDQSTHIRPDDLPAAVHREAARMGMADAAMYLTDIRQLVLSPFPASVGEPLDIDATDAGRCFRQSRTVETEDGAWMWFPMLDGTDRLGVLGARPGEDRAISRTRGARLAALAAELLLGKSAYGDNIVTTGRLKDLSLAAEVRWSLIPPLTFVGSDFSIAGFLEPAYDIAGDSFDYAVNGDMAHVAIFDAVGHGLEASRIANLALTAYRHSRRKGLDLAATYVAMDDVIEESFERSAFVTAQLATIDLADGTFRWLNAGHPAPLLLRGDQAQELTGPPALPAGIAEGAAEVSEFALEPDDVIAFYSDGVTEARSPADEEFGLERLVDLLVRFIAAGTNPPETVREILHTVVEHQEGTVADDATLVTVAWRPRPPPG